MKNLLFPLLILSLITCYIEIDISAPSFPSMAAYFAVSEGMIQYTIALNFLGVCLGCVIYGALSDAYGRRPVMVWGNGVLLLGSIACVFAPTIEWLLCARFFQGIGASTSTVVAFTMIADVYHGNESIKRISIMNSLLNVLPAIAPILGSFINDTIGWRGNYSSVAIVALISWIGLLLFLPETLDKPKPLSLSTLKKDYLYILPNKTFFKASAIPSLLGALYMAFVACAAFLYTQKFGLTTKGYALHQGIIVAAFSGVSFFIDSILKRFKKEPATMVGLCLTASGVLGLLWTGFVFPSSAIWTSVFMCIIAFGDAIVYPIIFVESLSIFPNHRGVAMSAIMCVRNFLIFAFTGLMGSLYNGTLLSYVFVGSIAFIPVAFMTVQLYKQGFLKESNP